MTLRIHTATFCLALFPFIFFSEAHAQSHDQSSSPRGIHQDERILFRNGDTLSLQHQFIQSLASVIVDSLFPAFEGKDFSLDRRWGKIIFAELFLMRLDTSKSMHVARVRYMALPFRFPPKLFLRERITILDTTRGDSIRVSTQPTAFTMESIFGSDLQKSGYIGRGFSIGTNRDLAISSGFRLQLSGKLSEDIEIVAALTDENTPIQPEGNTQTLQELDKTFIQISGKHLAGTFGDFNVNFSGTQFGSLNRKVKGLRGAYADENARTEVAYAKLRGSFQTNRFNGIDGVQGPYRLTGKNGEQHLLVVAGSERVYIDGMLMTRGETNDYIIEYANGEITFKPRRLITAYSRITVDFEYADRNYERSFFAAQGDARIFSDAIRVRASYAQEGDDVDSPIDLQLSESDKSLLEAAGNDQSLASRSGAVYSGFDTTLRRGAGQYRSLIDTSGGSQFIYYEFSPGSDSATYTVSFSYVGTGRGDYYRKAVGYFEYAGKGRGEYLPIKLLPLPQKKMMGNVALDLSPIAGLKTSGELAFSRFDQNTLSSLGDGAQDGNAYDVSIGYTTERLEIDGVRIGAFDLRFHQRESDPKFASIDRIDDVEIQRRWNLGALTAATEIRREASLGYSPLPFAKLNASLGAIRRGSFASNRYDARFQCSGDSIPAVNYFIENITSDDNTSRARSSWLRQRGEASHSFGFITPRVLFEMETKESHSGAADTLNADSFGFMDVRPGIVTAEFWRMTLAADVGIRTEDVFRDGAVRRESHATMQVYSWRLREWNSLSSSFSMTIRDKRYAAEYRARGSKDFQNVLTKATTRFTPFNRGIELDLYYEVATARTAKLEPVFLPRPYGQGDRRYVGDRNKNGILDDSDFDPALFGDGDWVKLLVPGDQLFPTLDLKTNARLRLAPSRFLSSSDDFLTTMLSIISMESNYRIEERSSDEETNRIYFLSLSHFLHDSTTIRGLQTQTHDIFFWESNATASLRLRFDQRRGFTQYALQNERNFRRELSARLRTRLVREIGMQLDVAHVSDNVTVTQASTRARAIASDSYTFDFSYQPWREVEIGFVMNYKSAVDAFPAQKVTADINAQTIRAAYSFAQQGRARFECERNEVLLKNAGEYFPFELTEGRTPGKSWIARLVVDYRITNFLQASLNYIGRIENERAPLHSARAEVKTFF